MTRLRFSIGLVWAPVLLMIGASSALGAWQQPERPAHDHDGDKTFKGRPIADVMSYLGADWLLRPTREEQERPDEMLDALKIQPGDVVADVGAGVGFHSLKLAERVGPEGLVYATDVQPEMLRMLRERAKEAGVENIRTALVTHDDPGLPANAIDLILMVDVYHEIADPEASLQGFLDALKPGGRLVLVEFRAEDPQVPIKPDHKMSVEQVRKEIEPAGFRFKDVLDFLPWQHIIIFEKPAAERGDAPDAEPAPSQADAPGC